MSADNFYAIKWNREDGLWYAIHGFMSSLEDGWPATIREGQKGFATEDMAEDMASEDWTEYGIIDDGFPDIVTSRQAVTWAKERVATLSKYIKFYEEEER